MAMWNKNVNTRLQNPTTGVPSARSALAWERDRLRLGAQRNANLPTWSWWRRSFTVNQKPPAREALLFSSRLLKTKPQTERKQVLCQSTRRNQ
jgi:hypothetical protein